MWVLAAEPRCVEAVDVATGQLVFLPLTLEVQQQAPRKPSGSKVWFAIGNGGSSRPHASQLY